MEVPIGSYFAIFIILVFTTLLMMLFFLIAIKVRNILDRYRLKYGFDKDIELKEMDNPKNLEKREKAFLRRTFKD